MVSHQKFVYKSPLGRFEGTIAAGLGQWRKVRTPKSTVAGNARPAKAADQRNRKEVQSFDVKSGLIKLATR
ncbi:MAG: hypothetical protein EBQ92_10400 [Proteobacteria bacterium]|nr:hypothetical protein [Pseudomonadota bacterium]